MTSRPMATTLLLVLSSCAVALLGAGCGGSSSGRGGDQGTPAPLPAAGDDRLIEEGDIVRVVGTDVFVLNAWKGLVIVSLADPARPRISARVPLGGQGTPVEMFIRDGQVLALVASSLDYLPCDACALGVAPIQNSELIVVDARAAGAPRIATRVGIPGRAQEARLAGDVLYAVSLAGNAVVTSIDVSDPARAQPLDRADVPVQGQTVHLHMRDGLLYVVVTDPTRPVGECGGSRQPDGCTFVSAVDVGAPDGRIRLGATYAMSGHMLDRDSIDLFDGVLRVLVREGSLVATHPAKLRTFQARGAGELEPLGSLLLGDEVSDQLTAVRFDGPRAFAVTARRIDPLYTLDLSDPAHPRVAGHLTSPGWLDHIEVRGDRLIALGGQLDAGPEQAGARQLQVSLYDVGDLGAPRMLDRVLFGAGTLQTVSDDRDQLGKVFRVVDERGLILVPYANLFSDQDWGYGRLEPHVQLVSFSAGTLALGGDVAHPGVVRRAIPYGTATILTLSEEALQVVDVSHPDAPLVGGRLELARNVVDAAFSNGKAVALSVDPGSGAAVLSAGPSDGFDVSAAGLPTLNLSTAAARLFLDGGLATLVSFRDRSPNTMVEVFDAGDPARIRRRGSVLFDSKTYISPVAISGANISALGPGAAVTMAGPSLAALVELSYPDPGFVAPGGLILVDLADPDHPALASRLDLPGLRRIGIVHAAAGTIAVATEEWAPGANMRGSNFQGAFFLHTVDVRDPRAPVVVKKALMSGAPLASSDRFVISDNGSIQSLNAAGELTPLATDSTGGGPLSSAALEDTRAVFAVGNRLDVIDLAPVVVGKSAALPGTGTVYLNALLGGRAFMATGEVIDLRALEPRQVAFFPPDTANTARTVRAEITTATGKPVRAYYVGGFRGIQAVPLD